MYSGMEAGLPDGIIINQKYIFGKILEGLAMADVGIFYVLRPLGICMIWPFGISPPFGMLYQEKSGNPGWKSSFSFRVTRLGEFSPNGQSFSFRSYTYNNYRST
jgi:hypothetical protein